MITNFTPLLLQQVCSSAVRNVPFQVVFLLWKKFCLDYLTTLLSGWSLAGLITTTTVSAVMLALTHLMWQPVLLKLSEFCFSYCQLDGIMCQVSFYYQTMVVVIAEIIILIILIEH